MIKDAMAAYLFSHGELPLKGIGVLRLLEEPPAYDVTTNAIAAPLYSLALENEDEASSQPLLRVIANSKQVTEEDAFDLYENAMLKIRTALEASKSYHWPGIGKFSGGETIGFTPEAIDHLQPLAVTANRLLARHRVPPPELAEAAFNPALLMPVADDAAPAERWWIGVLVLASIGILLIAMRSMGIW